MTLGGDIYGFLGAIVLVALLLAGLRNRPARKPRPRMIIPDIDEIRRTSVEDLIADHDPQVTALRAENKEMAEMLRLAFSDSAIERATFDRMRAATLAEQRIKRLKRNPRLMQSLRAIGASLGDLDHPDVIRERYKAKVKATHPDTGGNAEDFRAVNEAWNYIKPIMA